MHDHHHRQWFKDSVVSMANRNDCFCEIDSENFSNSLEIKH